MYGFLQALTGLKNVTRQKVRPITNQIGYEDNN